MSSLTYGVETAYAVGHNQRRVWLDHVDVLMPVVLAIVREGSKREIPPVCSAACLTTEAGDGGVILSRIGHEEVIKYDVNGRA